ncbi:MAG: hypothetical protein SEPTF4163_003694 [Sporothrix epigloea]
MLVKQTAEFQTRVESFQSAALMEMALESLSTKAGWSGVWVAAGSRQNDVNHGARAGLGGRDKADYGVGSGEGTAAKGAASHGVVVHGDVVASEGVVGGGAAKQNTAPDAASDAGGKDEEDETLLDHSSQEPVYFRGFPPMLPPPLTLAPPTGSGKVAKRAGVDAPVTEFDDVAVPVIDPGQSDSSEPVRSAWSPRLHRLSGTIWSRAARVGGDWATMGSG